MNTLLQQSLDSPVGQYWNGLKKEEVEEAILTNASKTGFLPTDFRKLFPESTSTVLDFGCGVGRNIDVLRASFSNFKQYLGYDLPGMLSLMTLEKRCKYDRTTSDFEVVKTFKPRIIFASLVFQHIPTHTLMRYLLEMSQWPNLLYVHSRWYNDQDKQGIMDIIYGSEIYSPVWVSKEALELNKEDYDPELHWSAIFASQVFQVSA